jgi:predicted ATPase/DNA-binding XRE family transcriptional regulator
MTEYTNSFGYWVRRRRKALDLSQADLAQQIPCSLATIKKIEADMRRPSATMAERLAICLGLSPRERSAFQAAARGLRTTDQLVLDSAPARSAAPIDRLPVLATPFVGRESELATLADLLAKSNVRLVSLVGPGGMGKTRVALAAAQAQQALQPRAFGDGIVFVDLAPVISLDFVVSAIAETLGLDLAPRRGDERSPGQQLLDFLRPRQMLLVLDNLEHLLDDGVVSLILDILRGAPAVRLLVTSRQRLKLHQEQLVTLEGLPYPKDDLTERSSQLEEYAAWQLFLTAARRLRPDFVLLPEEAQSLLEICRMVEGMPLALELAAAWVDTLSVSDIAAEVQDSLDILTSEFVDLPQRHRSIQAVFDASWQRLGAGEQEAYMGLSVFRGGFLREAAQHVAGASLPVLARFIDRCLLQFQPANQRYHLHEVLRQYGQEKLVSAGAWDSVRQRHFEYYMELAETAAARLFGPEQIAWLARLEVEHDNFRAALSWALANPAMTERAAQLAIALAWFWRMHSHVLEGRAWLERAVLLPDLATETQAGLLYHAGHLAWMQEDSALAQARMERSLQLWQVLGPSGRRGAGYAYHTLGMALYADERAAQGDLTHIIRAFQTSLSLFEEVADEWGAAFALSGLADCYAARGDRQAALAATAQSLARFRRLENPWGISLALNAAANLKLQAGELAEARRITEEAQTLRNQVGHRHSLAVGLELLAKIALQEDKRGEAAAFYQEAILVLESLGNRPFADEMRSALAEIATIKPGRSAAA